MSTNTLGFVRRLLSSEDEEITQVDEAKATTPVVEERHPSRPARGGFTSRVVGAPPVRTPRPGTARAQPGLASPALRRAAR